MNSLEPDRIDITVKDKGADKINYPLFVINLINIDLQFHERDPGHLWYRHLLPIPHKLRDHLLDRLQGVAGKSDCFHLPANEFSRNRLQSQMKVYIPAVLIGMLTYMCCMTYQIFIFCWHGNELHLHVSI